MFEPIRVAPYTHRMGLREPFALTDKISDRPGAKIALQLWASSATYYVGDDSDFQRFLLQYDIDNFKYSGFDSIDYVATFDSWVCKSDENLLDGIDFILQHINAWTGHEKLKEFSLITEAANLNYQYSEEAPYRLIHRVLPAVQKQYLYAARTVPEVTSRLLSNAWKEAYGHKGDPQKAWDEARKAVENILKPIVHPKNNNSTITKLIRDIEVKPGKYHCSIPLKPGEDTSPVLKFVELLKMMPYTEVHHGGNITLESVEPTRENAKTQALLAATICQIVADGGFTLAE